MKADEFVKHIKSAMPVDQELKDYGLDEEEAKAIQGTFLARQRTGEIRESVGELRRLVTQFDCSTVEVGLVRFLPVLVEHPQGQVFANCEADPVVIRDDGSVVMFDHTRVDRDALVVCAADQGRFLDALSKFVSIRKNQADWKGRASEAAAACANAAGGEKYKQFFLILCGFLD